MTTTHTTITGLEAHFLLYALDDYLVVDEHGKVVASKHGYTLAELQYLRDKLFIHHVHPDDQMIEYQETVSKRERFMDQLQIERLARLALISGAVAAIACGPIALGLVLFLIF